MSQTPSETPQDPTPSGTDAAAAAPADETERVRLTPPSEAMTPLVELAVAHVLDTLGRQPHCPPTVLAVAEDGRRGMWTLPDLTPEGAAEAVAALRPRPARAVVAFQGAVHTPQGPLPAIAVETFEAGQAVSVRLVQGCLPGVPGTDVELRVDGEPEVVANGPNPLASGA